MLSRKIDGSYTQKTRALGIIDLHVYANENSFGSVQMLWTFSIFRRGDLGKSGALQPVTRELFECRFSSTTEFFNPSSSLNYSARNRKRIYYSMRIFFGLIHLIVTS